MEQIKIIGIHMHTMQNSTTRSLMPHSKGYPLNSVKVIEPSKFRSKSEKRRPKTEFHNKRGVMKQLMPASKPQDNWDFKE